MFCSRDYQLTSRYNQQNEKSTSNYITRVWVRGAVLVQSWERLRLRELDYKNYRIFTLRCLHKDLVPISIKLKSTLKTERAKKIVRKVEKDLIQARIKAISSILDNVAKQTVLCRSSLASIISAQRLRECQGFIDKVGEIRFNKVKQRQLNKFQNLVNKKEGNITRVYNNNSPQVVNNLAASRQAGTHLPLGEGSNTSLVSPLLSPGEGVGPMVSQVGLGLGAHLPSGEAGSSSQATTHFPSREGSSSSQAIAHLPHREGSNSPPATAHLLLREGSSSQANTLPSPGGGRGNSQAGQVGNQVRSSRQGFRHSTRHRAPQASQGNRAASQTDSTNSREVTPTPTIRLPQGSSNEEPNPKWVINLSSKPLTPAQRSVLAKGPNFVVTPKQPTNLKSTLLP